MSRLLSSFVAVVLLLQFTPALAQEEFVPPGPTIPQDTAESPLQCFDYYEFGSVQADLQTNLSQTVPGASLTFSGDITNANDYPLVDGTLYVKIFLRDEDTFAEGDGNLVVDQFVVKDNINIPANGKTPAAYEWKVPLNAAGGEYYAAYFFATNERYNLMGLSFTDDVVGNQAQFTITNEVEANNITLSKVDTTLNGLNHNFAAFPLRFNATDTVIVSTTITNPTDKPKTVPLQWNQYAWDAMNPDNRRNTKTEVVTLAPNETKTVTYTAKDSREPVVYITAITQDQEAKSILNIRYVRDGIAETRINFPSLTQFPLAEGQAQTLFACAHSTNVPVVPGNTLTLTLTDKLGNTIHEYKYQGDIPGAMSGYGDTFTPSRNYNQTTLTATLEREGVIIEQVQIDYDCNTIDPNSCLPEPEEDQTLFDKIFNNSIFLFGGTLVLLLTLLLILFVHRRHKLGPNINVMNTKPPLSVLFFLLLLPAFFFATNVDRVEAKSVSWNTNIGGPFYYALSSNFWGYGLGNADITVTYGANIYNDSTGQLISDGASVPVGTVVRVEPNTLSGSDIYWFGAGGTYDSPYGHWVTGAVRPAPSCSNGDQVFYGPYLASDGFVALNAQPPTISTSVGGAAPVASLGGNRYRIDGNGAVIPTVTFDSTYGKFWYQWRQKTTLCFPEANNSCFTAGQCYGSNSAMRKGSSSTNLDPSDYIINVPQQTITFNLTATGGNNPPTTPTITGTTATPPNTSESFSFNATDPDGNTLRYGIDWDNNGSVDAWAPGSGYVTSGTSQASSRTWTSDGSYTFRALAQDSAGASSGWATHTVSVTTAPPPLPPSSCSTANIERDSASACQAEGYDRELLPVYLPGSAVARSAYINWTISGTTNQCGHVSGTGMSKGLVQAFEGGGCSGPLPLPTTPTSDLTINGSEGPLNVGKTDTLNIVWNSTNAASCTLYGTGLPGGSVALSGTASVPASAITSSPESYVLTCGGVVDSVSVTVQNQVPNPPTIGGDTSVETGQVANFTFTGTDPDNDQIFYEIDWDNNGTVDVSTPGSSYVNSGTTLPGTRSWPSTGSQTFQARTVDFDNARSGWAQYSINIVAGPPATVSFEAREGSNAWTTSDITVSAESTVDIQWSSTNASSCTGTGPGFSVGGTSGTDRVNTPTAGNSNTFTIDCGGATESITITSAKSNLAFEAISHNEGTINTTTGLYDNLEIRVIAKNTDRSRSGATTIAVRLTDGAGTVHPVETVNLPAINGNTDASTVSVFFNSVALGSFNAVVTLDPPTPGVVDESNEGDNEQTYTNSAAAPDPGLVLTTDRRQVQVGDTVLLRWEATAGYPGLVCAVTGPNLASNPTFTNASLPGSGNTAGISAKSEFILTCTHPAATSPFTTSVTVETVGTLEEV